MLNPEIVEHTVVEIRLLQLSTLVGPKIGTRCNVLEKRLLTGNKLMWNRVTRFVYPPDAHRHSAVPDIQIGPNNFRIVSGRDRVSGASQLIGAFSCKINEEIDPDLVIFWSYPVSVDS